jgi:hypothetical protein
VADSEVESFDLPAGDDGRDVNNIAEAGTAETDTDDQFLVVVAVAVAIANNAVCTLLRIVVVVAAITGCCLPRDGMRHEHWDEGSKLLTIFSSEALSWSTDLR